MHGKMRIQRPCNFRDRPTPFVVPRYSVARNDQIPRNSVQCVLLALAPVETPPGRNGDISSGSQRQCRFETNRIARSEKLCASRILTTLKEGVKGSEIRTRSVPVPTRNVKVNPDAGIPSTSESARCFGHDSPGANVACTEAAELVHALEVVRPQSISPEPGSNSVTKFVRDTFVEAGVSQIPAEVVSVERRLPAARARNVGAPDAKLAVRRVIENPRCRRYRARHPNIEAQRQLWRRSLGHSHTSPQTICRRQRLQPRCA